MSSDLGGEAGEPVGRDDLERYFHEAVTSAAHRRIGIEVELLPMDPATGRARPYAGSSGVAALFRELLGRGFEDPTGLDPPTQLRRPPHVLNLEPGAQVEVSAAPVDDLNTAARELEGLLAILREAAAAAGLSLIAHGLQPVTVAAEIDPVPKRRYAIMVDHLARRGGPRFRDMMRLTGSVQVNLDYTSERDAGRKLRAGLLASPVAAALFASSPIMGGRPTGRQSERTEVWRHTDPARCGALRSGLEEPFSFGRAVEELLDIPSILVRAEDGGVESAGGAPFRALLERGVRGRRVTRADWELHLSTVFTDARLRSYVEMRSADAPPPGALMTVPALFVGLLYHEPALDAALDLLAPLADGYDGAMERAARDGLRGAALDDATYADLARELCVLAEAGLRARGRGEERHLEPAIAMLDSGESFADRALAAFARGGTPALVAKLAI